MELKPEGQGTTQTLPKLQHFCVPAVLEDAERSWSWVWMRSCEGGARRSEGIKFLWVHEEMQTKFHEVFRVDRATSLFHRGPSSAAIPTSGSSQSCPNINFDKVSAEKGIFPGRCWWPVRNERLEKPACGLLDTLDLSEFKSKGCPGSGETLCPQLLQVKSHRNSTPKTAWTQLRSSTMDPIPCNSSVNASPRITP